jgi:hypothetical protein
MAAIKSSLIIPAQGVELVVLVDSLGTEQQLYLSISDAANRDANIAAASAQMDANVEAIHAYVSQTGAQL